jgi:ELWxxDGT repeat protein
VFVAADLTAPLAFPETSTSEIVPSSEPEELRAVGDVLFFTADDGIHGRELWRWERGEGNESQGQASLVTDLVPGPETSNPHYLFNSGGFLYFIANTADRSALLE